MGLVCPMPKGPVMRIGIIGGPGCGKSTLAQVHARKLGCLVLCTDTLEQAGGTGRAQTENVLYAPSQFTGQWSPLSQWVSDGWLNRAGPWVIEGTALIRALRKWHRARPGELPPVDRLFWRQDPIIDLSPGQHTMLSGHDTIAFGLLDEWPELNDLVQR